MTKEEKVKSLNEASLKAVAEGDFTGAVEAACEMLEIGKAEAEKIERSIVLLEVEVAKAAKAIENMTTILRECRE